MKTLEIEVLTFQEKDALIREWKGRYPEIKSAPLQSPPRFRAGLEAKMLTLARVRPHFEIGGVFVMNYLGGARLVNYVEGKIDKIPQGIPIDLTEVDAGRADTVVVFHSHPIGLANFSLADLRCFEHHKALMWELLYEKMLNGLNDGGDLSLYDAVCNLDGEFKWIGQSFWARSGGKIPTLFSKLAILPHKEKPLILPVLIPPCFSLPKYE